MYFPNSYNQHTRSRAGRDLYESEQHSTFNYNNIIYVQHTQPYTTSDGPAFRVYIAKMKFIGFSLILAACLIPAFAQDTLVLLDNLAIRETHSIFFKSLQGNLLMEG